ncbi:MAG TPA: hypothetical protein VLG69_02430 [Candidatus Andersenbacteria bacterium]|nr:hypothetical protein [Candidatus Andersenbacteria bacterium]
MKIIFLGNVASYEGKTRLEELRKQLYQNGHEIIEQYGFTKVIIAILGSRITNPNTIHVHSLRSAFLVAILRVAIPQRTTAIWTLDTIPEMSSSLKKTIFRYFISFISSSFNQLCVPTRTLQYRLLADYGIKSLYIPDGYTKPILKDVQPREYGLRINQYGVLFSQSLDAVNQIAEVYKATKSKKKLVIFSRNPSPEFKKLIKQYAFITPISLPFDSRGAQSIVRSAGFLVMCDPLFSPLLLQAMDTNRVVIATTNPLHEEILGTTGFYFHKDDALHLQDLLQKATKDMLLPKYSPSIRAKHHFTWEKTGIEYEQLYTRKIAKLVPFDSVLSKSS